MKIPKNAKGDGRALTQQDDGEYRPALLLSQIIPSGVNPRKIFDEAGLVELAESIKAKGVLQPVLVRPRPGAAPVKGGPVYELAAGERRWRAAKLAGLTSIPATIRELSDLDMLEIAVVENEQRADVSPLEKAAGYAALAEKYRAAGSRSPIEDLSEKVGKSPSTIRGLIKVHERLPDTARRAVADGRLPLATAGLLARVPGEQARELAAQAILAGNSYTTGRNNDPVFEPLSYREAKQRLEYEFMVELKGAPFSQKDAKLLPGAGACTHCPKKAGNNREEYPDTRPDVCTDPACFRQKVEAQRQQERAKAERAGIEVLSEGASQDVFAFDGIRPRWAELTDRCQLSGLLKVRPQPKTWAEAIAGLPVQQYLAYDRQGKPHTVIKQADAVRALRDAGRSADPDFDRPKENAPSPPKGSPEHLDSLADRMGLPREDFRSDHASYQPEPKKPTPHQIRERAARNAGQVLYAKLDQPHPDLCEPLRLLCLGKAWEMSGRGDGKEALDLANGVLSMLDHFGRDDDDRSPLAPFHSWIGRAHPDQLVGFLLKAAVMRLTTYPDSADNEAAQALLKFGKLDWDQLQEQAKQELMGKPEGQIPARAQGETPEGPACKSDDAAPTPRDVRDVVPACLLAEFLAVTKRMVVIMADQGVRTLGDVIDRAAARQESVVVSLSTIKGLTARAREEIAAACAIAQGEKPSPTSTRKPKLPPIPPDSQAAQVIHALHTGGDVQTCDGCGGAFVPETPALAVEVQTEPPLRVPADQVPSKRPRRKGAVHA